MILKDISCEQEVGRFGRCLLCSTVQAKEACSARPTCTKASGFACGKLLHLFGLRRCLQFQVALSCAAVLPFLAQCRLVRFDFLTLNTYIIRKMKLTLQRTHNYIDVISTDTSQEVFLDVRGISWNGSREF